MPSYNFSYFWISVSSPTIWLNNFCWSIFAFMQKLKMKCYAWKIWAHKMAKPAVMWPRFVCAWHCTTFKKIGCLKNSCENISSQLESAFRNSFTPLCCPWPWIIDKGWIKVVFVDQKRRHTLYLWSPWWE